MTRNSTSHFIDDRWIEGQGPPLISHHPATGEAVWQGAAATDADVDQAIRAAQKALPRWRSTSLTERIEVIEAFARQLDEAGDEMMEAICLETGKPRWEAKTELAAMVAKASTTIEAFRERRGEVTREQGGDTTATRYRPHGVLVVIGPFNFPGHIPNGHIMPALLAGNCVVFKPSELTPLCGQRMAEFWQQAGLPPCVFNLVQGRGDTGAALTNHQGHDGILFTGSFDTGIALRRALLDKPQKILALELGGNNPLVVHDVADVDAAAYLTVLSAYLTAGQRCTCARRLIVPRTADNDRFVDRLLVWIDGLRVGRYEDDPEPFMGPVISEKIARGLLAIQDDLISRGGLPLRQMRPTDDRITLLSPGLIDVSAVSDRADVEWFGPLLQLIRTPDFDAAIDEANRTAYGLVAGLFSDRREHYQQFYERVRAGLINWNRQTTGASGKLPFGGVGHSGNHRPSGYFAVDYCNYPVASLESDILTLPHKRMPGFDM